MDTGWEEKEKRQAVATPYAQLSSQRWIVDACTGVAFACAGLKQSTLARIAQA
jgi:hypothetical protein